MVRKVYYSKLRTELMFLFYRYLSNGVDEPMKKRLSLFYKRYSDMKGTAHPAFEDAVSLCGTILEGKTVDRQEIEETLNKLKQIDLENL